MVTPYIISRQRKCASPSTDYLLLNTSWDAKALFETEDKPTLLNSRKHQQRANHKYRNASDTNYSKAR